MCHIAFNKIALKNDRPLAIAISYLHYNTKCELWSGKAPINRSTNHILYVLYHKHYRVGIVLPRHLDLKVDTSSNTGDAGGTITTFTLGDLKIATGTTSGVTAVGEYSRRVIFPAGFFSNEPHFIANISRAYGSVGNNYVIGNNPTKEYADIYWSNKTGNSGVGGEVGWIAIGS